jgi:hypothetical protein
MIDTPTNDNHRPMERLRADEAEAAAESAPPSAHGKGNAWVTTAGEDGEVDAYHGKRCFRRRLAEGMSFEASTDPGQSSATWVVHMHNVSETGLSFWSRKAVATRHALHVRELREEGPGEWLPTWVHHCTFGIRGFLIGASFEHRT